MEVALRKLIWLKIALKTLMIQKILQSNESSKLRSLIDSLALQVTIKTSRIRLYPTFRLSLIPLSKKKKMSSHLIKLKLYL